MATTYFTYVDYTDDGRPFYVGIGDQNRVDLLERVKNHKHTNVAKKHGQNRKVTFESECWETVAANEELMIRVLRTYHHDDPTGIGCNFTRGGDGTPGYVFTEEQRQTLSAAMSGRSLSDETKQRMSAAKKGTVFTAEARAKMSASRLGKKRGPHSEATRAKIAESVRQQHARRRAAGGQSA